MNPGVFGFPQRLKRFLTTVPPLTGGGNVSDPPPIGFDPSYLRGFLAGFGLTNSAGDLTNDIDVGAGVCVNSTGTRFIKLAAGVTRQLDVAFGTGNGGLSSSLIATISNQTYHYFAVLTATGVASVGIDTSPIAATLITDHGITAFRRILSIRRVSGVLQPIIQRGDHVRLVTPVLDVNATATGTGATTRTLPTLPIGIILRPDLLVQCEAGVSANAAVLITSLTETASAPTVGGLSQSFIAPASTRGPATSVTSVYSNVSGQVRTQDNTADQATHIHTMGWWDRRGQDD